MSIKTVGILTGGGDCPGLNAVIRAITKTAIIDYGWKVIGIQDGFQGAFEKRAIDLSYNLVSNILNLGGTILGTSNKANPFNYTLSKVDKPDQSDFVVDNLKKFKLDVLFCVGGDGTLTMANKLRDKFPNIIGIPKTIDNDLEATDQTFGFDTACQFVTDSIDRIHSTAQSHHRAMVIEVMGRYAGWIALASGIAGGGDIILIPELPFKYEKIIDAIELRKSKGKKFSIIVVSEGAHAENENAVVRETIPDSPDPIRLGGIGQIIANHIQSSTGIESRVTVLGHLQRGGTPTFYDRLLATRYGVKAVRLASKEEFGKMVALKSSQIIAVNLESAVRKLKLVSKDCELIKSAMSTGTSFGI